MTEARRLLLAPALELQDGIRRYREVLGDDGGRSAAMSRSSHRDLLTLPARKIDEAWKVARLDLRGTAIATALQTGFESRTAALRPLNDAPEHTETWDRTVLALGEAVDALIALIEDEDPDHALAHRLGYRTMTAHRPGGYGVLYRAEDMAGVVHAVKLLHPHPTISKEKAEPRFQREAAALTKLSHPNIVSYRRLAQVDGRWFLEMDFIPGTSLLDWVKTGTASFTDRLRAIVSLLRAVQHAHEQGVFHRDIKPDNVLMRDDGAVFLVDFGLAWIADIVDSSFTTHSTWSLDYAPPEVREDPTQSRGPNHDIYSVGIVLHQLLTGRRPPAGPLANVDASLAIIEPILQCSLAPLPARFSTAGEFADALDRALSGLEQPWLARAADAGRIQSTLLRDALLAAAHDASEGDVNGTSVALAGTFDALRIHVQRCYRFARASDAPRHEARIPARLSPAAAAVFPEFPSLSQEPVLAEDKYGEAAFAAMGFSMSDLTLLQRLVEFTHPLRTAERAAIPTPTESDLIRAHQRLVERIAHLEASDPEVMGAFDEQLRVVPPEPGLVVETEDAAPRTPDELLVLLAKKQGTGSSVGHVRFGRDDLQALVRMPMLDLADMITALESRELVHVQRTQGHSLPLETRLTHTGREAAHRQGASVPSPVSDADELRRQMRTSDAARGESSGGQLAKLTGWPVERVIDAARVLSEQGHAEVRQKLAPDGFRAELTAEGRLAR